MVYALKEPRARKLDRYRRQPLKIIELCGKNAVLESKSGKRIYKHLNKLWPAPQRNTERDCYIINIFDVIDKQ